MVDGLSINLDAQPLTMTSDLSLLTDAATLDLTNAELTFSVPQDATPQGESRMARLDANRRSADG